MAKNRDDIAGVARRLARRDCNASYTCNGTYENLAKNAFGVLRNTQRNTQRAQRAIALTDGN